MSVGSAENLVQSAASGSHRPELQSSRSEDIPDSPKTSNIGYTSHQTVSRIFYSEQLTSENISENI